MNPVKMWLCRLVCCGRDDGVVECESWEQADAFREAYTSGVGVALHGYSAPAYESGHRRAVIVTQEMVEDVLRRALAVIEHRSPRGFTDAELVAYVRNQPLCFPADMDVADRLEGLARENRTLAAALRERDSEIAEAVRWGYRRCYDAHSHDPSGLYIGRILDEAVAAWKAEKGRT